jgi:hypothetical protein
METLQKLDEIIQLKQKFRRGFGTGVVHVELE